MNEEKRVKCPFCGELILPNVGKCRFCKKWLDKGEGDVAGSSSVEDDLVKVEEVVSGGGGFYFRVVLGLTYVVLVVLGIIYEVKAREVLDYAREMEGKGKYEVAHLSYQIMAKKYPLSYVVSDAMIGISRIDVDSFSFDLPELGATFLERLSGGRVDSRYHYGLPLVASMICGAVCLLMVLVRIFQSRLPVFAFFLAAFSGFFFVVQATAYGWVGFTGSFFDVSIKVMKSYELVYAASCALLVMVAVETLRGAKK